MPPYLQGGFDIFAEEVVPILRMRGLFRHDYEGATLRDHFGLPRPDNTFSQPQKAIAELSSHPVRSATDNWAASGDQ